MSDIISIPVNDNTIPHPWSVVSKPYMALDEGGGTPLWFMKVKDSSPPLFNLPPGLSIGHSLRFGDTDAAGGKRWARARVTGLTNTELRFTVHSTNVPGLLAPRIVQAEAGRPAQSLDTSSAQPARAATGQAHHGRAVASEDHAWVTQGGAPRPSVPASDTAGPALLPMAIAPRLLLNIGAWKPTLANVTSLEEVERQLDDTVARQAPKDVVVDLRETELEVHNGMLILCTSDLGIDPLMGLTRTGMRGLLTAAFSKHSIQYGEARKMWRVLMHEGLEESKVIIPMAWHLLTKKCDIKVQLRTVLTKDPRINSVARVVRSVTSADGYTAVDDLSLIKALRASGQWQKACVASYSKSDDFSSLRILPQGLPSTVDTPAPVLDLRNSETGCLSIRMDGGSYVLRCTNGMFSVEHKGSMRWNHTGNLQRILNGLASGADAVMREASGITANYLEARAVRVEGMAMWMQQRLAELRKQGLKERTATAALASLGQHTGSRPDTVAYAADAITLAAQNESDLDERRNAEEFGYLLVMDALSKARAMRESGREAVLVPVVAKGEA